MNKAYFIFAYLVLGISVAAMTPQREQEDKPSKLACVVAGWVGTTPFAYFMIKKHCPCNNECINLGLAASIGMFGQFFCMQYYYPATAEENALHDQQFNFKSEAVDVRKKIEALEKAKKD